MESSEHLMIFLAMSMFMFAGYLPKKEKEAGKKSKNHIEELKRAAELKDLFIDILRHDLLNSIGIIKQVVEILEEDPSLAGSREIEMLKRNALKHEELIKTASKYAEIANVEELDFKVGDISPMIKGVVEDFKYQADEKNITIENTVKREYPARIAPFIEDVFSNIISNAIKYSPENTKVIIGAEDLGGKIRVMVKDQGIGIKDEYKERVFQRFTVGGKEGIKGTGLGLAIVKRIVDLHQGKVWVEDNPEGGSIFYVEIPKKI
jgi:hypothetical protein